MKNSPKNKNHKNIHHQNTAPSPMLKPDYDTTSYQQAISKDNKPHKNEDEKDNQVIGSDMAAALNEEISVLDTGKKPGVYNPDTNENNSEEEW